MSNLIQCKICQKWCTNKQSLLIHLRFCHQRHTAIQDDANHLLHEHNPLQSSYNQGDHLNPFAVYDDLDISNSDDDSVDNNNGNNMDNGYSSAEDFNMNGHDVDQVDIADDVLGGDHKTHGQCSTAVSKLQIRLNNVINTHKAPLRLYDDVVHLFNDYISSDNFSKHAKLRTRKSFIKQIEATHPSIMSLHPVNKQVTLHDGIMATVPVFDAQAMIMDILSNSDLMKKENFADGYDIFNGDVDENHQSNKYYGEIHTGDEWIPARDKFCRPGTVDMPVSLVIFGDKSHTDLHGALALTPIIFTLTLFNQRCRNDPKFWRVLGYLPNLGHGKNKSNKTPTVKKIQDEHDCLSCVFESVRMIHRNGGFRANVLGKDVRVKIWIHYFIGDTEGNNKWLGHYSGNKSQVYRPYRDCSCSFDELSNHNPTCIYSTLHEMRCAYLLKLNDEAAGLDRYRELSRYPIKNALSRKYMPLSDNVHGPSRMMPPEVLHVFYAGLLRYIFTSMQFRIGSTMLRDEIDKMHVRVTQDVKRQSDRDLPRGSMRNGIIDDTKCQSEERQGNFFLLLCIATTTTGEEKLKLALGYNDRYWVKWLQFVKLYLSMCAWLHDSNLKEEVNNARPLIAKVLQLVKVLFPRDGSGNGWNLPKFHAATKFTDYISRYGSAINFFGGTGESAHKLFVKAPGQKTQRRPSEFAHQVAEQHYNMLVTTKALRSVNSEIDDQSNTATTSRNVRKNNDENIVIDLSGQYMLHITDLLKDKVSRGENIYPEWKTNLNGVKSNNYKFRLQPKLVFAIINKVQDIETEQNQRLVSIKGHTRLTITSQDGTQVIYHANPHIMGKMWYDWVFVHFEEMNALGETVESYYPSKILGFVKFKERTEAVIHCTEKPLRWSSVKKKFLVKVSIGKDPSISIVTVPISSFVHPLCVIPDYGGEGTSYIVVLPRRNWSQYFGTRIKID